jgi:RND family efflux transporter MFP subunit
MAWKSFLPLKFACAATVMLPLAGCARRDRSVAQPARSPSQPVVRMVAVMQEEVQRTTVQPATVHPFYESEIRTKVSGYVKELLVDMGDHVAAGDPLLVIDVPELVKQRQTMAARVRSAEAQQERAEAEIQLAVANVQSATARLAQAKSEMDRTDASLAAVEAEFARTSDLVQRQSLERRMLDEVRKKRDSELAAQQAVSSAILSAEADVTVSQAKLASARADLDVAKSNSDIARSQLEELDVLVAYSTLKAPFAGVITSRHVDLGDLVLAEGQGSKGPSLFTLIQVERVRIQSPIPEAEAAIINPGDTMTVSFPSFPLEESINATITRLSGSLDPSTRTMLVEAEVDNRELKLIPGMFGQATITVEAKVATSVLPARAVRFDETGNAFVYAINSEDTIEVVPVTTGIDDGKRIEITTGVGPGQRVVDAHLKRFTSGQKVTLLAP